jgi:hypothetical protein
MNIEPYPPGQALLGPEAPPPSDRLSALLRYLATIYERFGDTTVAYRVRWGASGLWAESEPRKSRN